ncbi:MAG: metal ABC transporter substrate-binding protein [Proteobacteria bacterium]|nr:metal ABC transporter substrate-binding protein [Pseudomonadota bacterium]
MRKLLMIFIMFCLYATPALAKLNVVTTLPWIGSIAYSIGGDKIKVTALVKANQDPHSIEAKPSMILAARNADIIMYNGLDLEIGYLPLLIESSRNPKIQPGRPGNLDCSNFVEVIEKNTASDRSMGDVHPLGNPHYHISPKNMGRVAKGITRALSGIDPENAQIFEKNLALFNEKLKKKQNDWASKNIRGKKFVSYHKYFEYLASEYNFRIIGYVEQKPGIPPSAAYIESLIDTMKKTKPDSILTIEYYGSAGIELLTKRTGVKSIVVPHEVGSARDIHDWFGLMDAVFKSLE